MIVHIAGSDVRIDDRLRQRCAWCGEILIDYDLDRIAVPAGQQGGPGVWPVGALVAVNGSLSHVVEHDAGEALPDEACSR